MKINTNFSIEDIVYLKTDIEQLPRIVTGIIVRKNSLLYYLTNGTTETCHYDFEISLEKTFIL